MPNLEEMTSQNNIGKQRGSCADYNANNSWYFNGTNGCVNNNNRYNSNFRCRPCLDYGRYDNANLDRYPVTLEEWLMWGRETAKGKGGKPCYAFFILHRIDELVQLAHEVGNCEIMPTESTAHIIFEPRVREIVCAAASKRVMQAFYIRSLQPYLERYLYHDDSYSCRPGKGGLHAVEKLQDYIFEQSEGYTADLWLAKVDIQAFFMSLDCFQVCQVVTDFIRDVMRDHPHRELLVYMTRVVYLAATKDHIKDMARPAERALLDPAKSLYNHPYYNGVPIGDWTSQTAGLIITTFPLRYLESLGYKFIHYTDDTVVLVRDKEKWLGEDLPRLELFYKRYGLTLHPKKRYLQHYSKGVEALGFKVRFNRILPSDRIYHNMNWYIERTTKRFAGCGVSEVMPYEDKVQDTVNSYLGMLRHMNGFRLREWLCDAVASSSLGLVLEPSANCEKVTIRPMYTKKNYYLNECKKLKQSLKLAS